MKYATIPNCQHKAYIQDYPELNEVLAIVTTMDGRELYKAAYRSENTAINSIKRRLLIDKDRQELLVYKPKDGAWRVKGWR